MLAPGVFGELVRGVNGERRRVNGRRLGQATLVCCRRMEANLQDLSPLVLALV